QVRRNIGRFPDDFMFELTEDEFENLRCHLGTPSSDDEIDNLRRNLRPQDGAEPGTDPWPSPSRALQCFPAC
ncbi:MAG: ORF6N domain-containing protein, partial [Spirochaetes bacterium]|nr:ORF6N domain-containing protein [Spirochaetota bacterium]